MRSKYDDPKVSTSSSSSSSNSPDVSFACVVSHQQDGSFEDFMKFVSFAEVPSFPFVAGHCFYDAVDFSLENNRRTSGNMSIRWTSQRSCSPPFGLSLS